MITIRIPSSSANLGSGFDTLGLALDLHLEVRCTPAQHETTLQYRGRDVDRIPRDASNLILRAARHVAKTAGSTLPHVDLAIENHIPLARGLGSSGAAILSGVLLANELCALKLNHADLLTLAYQVEGHADNITASLRGGLTTSCVSDDDQVLSNKLPIHPTVKAIIIVPDFHVCTEQARALLPQTYSRNDFIFNLQRVALLSASLADPSAHHISEAMRDRLHQPYRQALIPGAEEILQIRDIPDLLGLCISGSGPSILALATGNFQEIAERVQHVFDEKHIASEILVLDISTQGITISHEHFQSHSATCCTSFFPHVVLH